ncbi:MAG TPA: helix-turn-helix transcriptional regulator [Myxococcota bacterium]|nr:helix-turn-helix transcriptional regulator [Myxococcota bacterium]
MANRIPVGSLLRGWRQRRRKSQLALACDADISTRHLSFIETGRAQPSREMVLHLAESLDVPLRERNVLLTAAGFAPTFPARTLDDPALRAAREAVDFILAGHEPNPALAVDTHWTLLASNQAVAPLLAGVAPELLRPPVNVMRLALHPRGLAPRTANLAEWRAHLLARLQRQIELTADRVLMELDQELRSYPTPIGVGSSAAVARDVDASRVAVPFQLRTERGVLSFYSTTTVFGTPVDVTLSELALESFFPADAATAAALRAA